MDEATRHEGVWTDIQSGVKRFERWWECDWCSALVFDGGAETIDDHLTNCPDREST